MILLTSEEIITLHDKLIDRTGGTHGLRDKSLLESAVYSAVSSFQDNEDYLNKIMFKNMMLKTNFSTRTLKKCHFCVLQRQPAFSLSKYLLGTF